VRVGSTQDENADHNSNELSSVTERKEETEKKKILTYQNSYNFY
jgi:hypothetical protein